MKREYKASIWMKLWIKRIAGKKNILLLMLLFLILTIYLEPLKSFVSISGYKISPWVYPFLITDSNFLIIFMCGVICFFSNTIFFKAKDCYYFLRMGRKKWIVMELGYVILSAVMISVLNIIMTWGVLNIKCILKIVGERYCIPWLKRMRENNVVCFGIYQHNT